MSRIKLGLFGAARPSNASSSHSLADVRHAEAQDRLAGLTPVEIAAVEAMSRTERGLAAR